MYAYLGEGFTLRWCTWRMADDAKPTPIDVDLEKQELAHDRSDRRLTAAIIFLMLVAVVCFVLLLTNFLET